MPQLPGTCLCGSVTWTYSGETTRNLVCHCADCQRATSAPFTAFLGLKPEGLKWSDAFTDYQSSPGTFRGFCPACRTRLYFYRPDAQVVMRSKAGWLDRLQSIPAFDDFQANPVGRTEP